MLTISNDTARRAFECYIEHYTSEGSRAWGIQHKMRLYASAEGAFEWCILGLVEVPPAGVTFTEQG